MAASSWSQGFKFAARPDTESRPTTIETARAATEAALNGARSLNLLPVNEYRNSV